MTQINSNTPVAIGHFNDSNELVRFIYPGGSSENFNYSDTGPTAGQVGHAWGDTDSVWSGYRCIFYEEDGD